MAIRLRMLGGWTVRATVVAGLMAQLIGTVVAQTIGGTAPAATEAQPAAKVDPISVPEGTPAELLSFINTVKVRRPTAADYPTALAQMTAVHTAVIGAAERILAAKATDDETKAAASEKLRALMMLRRLGAADGEARAKAYLEELQQDPRPFLPPLAKVYVLAGRLDSLDRNDPAEVEKLVADVRAHVQTASPDGVNLSVAFQTARVAEAVGLNQLAADAYREFAVVFAKSTEPAVVANAKKLEGSARLLSLPGNNMELSGKKLDGSTFDLKSLEGKTVLVDFWATWCGPCIAELPTVKECYAKYHARGFEVVGISLDSDKQRLEAFLGRDPLPWPVLFSDDPQANGWNHPLAAHYGIMSIPRAILINKAGKVVSLQARGEDLWELLGKEIGPPTVGEPKPAAGEAKPLEVIKPAELPKTP